MRRWPWGATPRGTGTPTLVPLSSSVSPSETDEPGRGRGGALVIAGSPEGAGAEVLGREAADLVEAGESALSHGRVITAEWSGNASDAAAGRIDFLGRRTRIGGEVAAAAVPVLMDYAQELRMAQAQYAAGAAEAAAGEAALETALELEAFFEPKGEATVLPEALNLRLGEREKAQAHEQISAGQHEMTAAVARRNGPTLRQPGGSRR